VLHAADATGTPQARVDLPAEPLGFQIIGTTLYAGFVANKGT